MIADEEIKKVFEKIEKSLLDCFQSMRLAEPIILGQGNIKNIDGTNIANAVLVIRDALLHRAISAIIRIYDINNKNNRNRMSFGKLFQLMHKDPALSHLSQEFKVACESISSSDEFKQLRKIKNSRISHQLEESETKLSYAMLTNLAYQTLKIVKDIYLVVYDKELKDNVFHEFWLQATKDLWSCVFTEGQKYATKNKNII